MRFLPELDAVALSGADHASDLKGRQRVPLPRRVVCSVAVASREPNGDYCAIHIPLATGYAKDRRAIPRVQRRRLQVGND